MENIKVVFLLLIVGLIDITDTQNRKSDLQTLDDNELLQKLIDSLAGQYNGENLEIGIKRKSSSINDVTDERETIKERRVTEARQDSEIPTEYNIRVRFPEHQSDDLNEDDVVLKTLASFLPTNWARTLESWLKYDLTYKGRSTSPTTTTTSTTTTPTTTKSSSRCKSSWWRRRRRSRC